jgi:hypothetical protein
MEYAIDKHIPPPPPRDTPAREMRRYPFREMLPGDSCFIPRRDANQIGGAVACARRAVGGTWTSETHTENGVRGVRVWRLT